MSEKLNATCSICGGKYHVCNDCSNTKSFTPWRKISCSINCYKIFLTLNDFTHKRITINEAKTELSNYDISKVDTFQDNIKSSIKQIIKDNRSKKLKASSNENTGEINSDLN